MTDYKDRLKKLLPSGYDALFGAKPAGYDPDYIKNLPAHEWQSIVDLHQMYIDDFKAIPYDQVTNRQKEFFRNGVEEFAILKRKREGR